MPFLPSVATTQVPSSGPKSARIVIVVDYPSGFDLRAMRLLSSTDGTLLEQVLHSIGLIRGEVYITSLFKTPGLSNYTKGKLTEVGKNAAGALIEELEECKNCNVIVAMGEAAFYALTGSDKLAKYRGYLFSTPVNGHPIKVIGTHHPRDAIHANYLFRYLISADLTKAKTFSTDAILERPDRHIVLQYSGIAEVLAILKEFETVPKLAFDIEVLNYEVSCISFAKHPYETYSIPIAGVWSLEEECQLWLAINRVLSNPNSAKIVQNGIFDIQFILSKNGILVQGPIYDTMIAHHIMYSDLPKNLGFLGSLYCGAQEYWKDTVKFSNIKEES